MHLAHRWTGGVSVLRHAALPHSRDISSRSCSDFFIFKEEKLTVSDETSDTEMIDEPAAGAADRCSAASDPYAASDSFVAMSAVVKLMALFSPQEQSNTVLQQHAQQAQALDQQRAQAQRGSAMEEPQALHAQQQQDKQKQKAPRTEFAQQAGGSVCNETHETVEDASGPRSAASSGPLHTLPCASTKPSAFANFAGAPAPPAPNLRQAAAVAASSPAATPRSSPSARPPSPPTAPPAALLHQPAAAAAAAAPQAQPSIKVIEVRVVHEGFYPPLKCTQFKALLWKRTNSLMLLLQGLASTNVVRPYVDSEMTPFPFFKINGTEFSHLQIVRPDFFYKFMCDYIQESSLYKGEDLDKFLFAVFNDLGFKSRATQRLSQGKSAQASCRHKDLYYWDLESHNKKIRRSNSNWTSYRHETRPEIVLNEIESTFPNHWFEFCLQKSTHDEQTLVEDMLQKLPVSLSASVVSWPPPGPSGGWQGNGNDAFHPTPNSVHPSSLSTLSESAMVGAAPSVDVFSAAAVPSLLVLFGFFLTFFCATVHAHLVVLKRLHRPLTLLSRRGAHAEKESESESASERESEERGREQERDEGEGERERARESARPSM